GDAPPPPDDDEPPEVPGRGGTPGTPGRPGVLPPPSSTPGTCTSPTPGTPTSIGGVVTGGRTWACADPAQAHVAPNAHNARTPPPAAPRRGVISPPRPPRAEAAALAPPATGP